MAKSQIGAVIGIEGATEFSNNMRILARETKLFNSEMKALTSTFDKNAVTLQNVSQKRDLLNRQLVNARERLYQQKTALDKVNQAASTANVTDDKWAATHDKLQTEINQTTAEIQQYEQELKNLPNAARLMMDAWDNSTSDWGELFKRVGGVFTKYVTVPLAAGAGVAVKTAIDYQTAFTGVKKTVNQEVNALTKEVTYSYEDLNAELKKIPLNTASTYQQVAAVAEAAGQLGIEIRDIPKYAKNIIMLGDTTNISAEEAATSIAQFMNIVGDSTDTIDKFGGSLVALGNNTATDEASIMRLATRLASAGHLVGLSTPQILGLSAAMSSVGLTAEAGGTAMSQAMTKISKAVAKGGDTLELFGQVTGQTGEQFAETWRNEPIRALEEFLIGMSNLEGGSEELILKLDELGFSGIRESDTLRRLTSDYDGVTSAVALAEAEYRGYNEELGKHNALSEEAEKKYETWEAQISQLKESLLQLADQIGQDLVPDLINLVDGVKDLVEQWKNMNPETKQFWINLGKVLLVVGPLLSGIGNLMIFFAKLKGSISVLKGVEGIGGLVSALSGKGGLTGALDGATTAAQTLSGEAGLGSIIPALGGTLSAVGIFAGAMYLLLNQNWEETQEWANQMEEAIGGVNQDWDTYGQTVSTTLDETGAYIDTYAEANSRTIKGYAGDTKEYTHKTMGEMKKIVNDNMVDIQHTATTNSAYAAQNTSMKFGEMKNTVTSNMSAMRGSVTEEGARIQSEWASKLRGMKDTTATEGTGLVSTFKIPMTGIERAANVDLSTSGAHMMESMKRGISAHSGGVISMVANVAAQVRSFLGFSEPEKGPLSNFHTFMPDMMKLMAKGINDNTYLVQDALDNVSSLMASNLEGRGDSVSYGGVTINLNVPQGTDGRSLVDQIETEIANRTMRRRMVFN